MNIRITEAEAKDLAMRVLEKRMGAPCHIAEASASALIDASLRGIDSHGIRLLPYYIERWEKGQIVPDAEPVTVKETSTTGLLDACQTLGHYASAKAVESAVAKARKAGMGAVVIRNSNHNAATGYYAIQIAEKQLLGIVATACAPHVAPHGGTKGLHGTNPMAYAIPRKKGRPVVFDFSTGHSAAKLKELAKTSGRTPEGYLVDAEGRPSTDPGDVHTGWILPVAGNIGYGLGLLVDALTCGLADSPIGQQIPLVSNIEVPYAGTFTALALSPNAFGGWDGFDSRIDALASQIRNNLPQNPEEPVRLPGERGWKEREVRLREGIPIESEEWEQLQELVHSTER